MFNVSRWWLIAALLVMLGAASCGGSSSLDSGLTPGLQAGNSPASVQNGNAALPGIPHESGDPVRGVSTGEGSSTVLGDAFLQQQNGAVDGTSLRLESHEGEGGLAWALYRFEGLSGKKPLSLVSQTAPDPDSKFFVAVANYTDQSWQWFGPYSLPEANINLEGSNDRYITELGNFYFLIVAEGGSAATHFETSLSFRDSDPLGGGELPGAPFDLWASDGDHADGVQVSWQGGDGAGTFEVWRRLHEAQGDAEAWHKIGETADHGYFDNSVELGVKYRYKVRARNEQGESAFSNIDTGYSAEGGPGGDDWCPSELAASDGTSMDWVELNWNPGTGDATHFKIWRRVDGGGDFEVIADTNDHFYHDTTAEPGVWYIYKVERLGEGQDCFSNTDAGFRASEANDNCPSELVATDGTRADGVKLEWAPGLGGGTFLVFRAANEPGAQFQQIGTTMDAGFLDTTAVAGVTYQYKVFKTLENQTCGTNIDTGWRAQDGGGSDFCPYDFTASDGTSADGVVLGWSQGVGDGLFNVWRKPANSVDGWVMIAQNVSGETYTDTTTDANAEFTYKVVKHTETQECASNTDNGFRGATGGQWCPSDLVATDGTYADKIRVEWNTGTGDGALHLWRKRDGNFDWIDLGAVDGAGYNDTNFDAGVVYIYKLVKTLGQDTCESNTDSGYAGNPI